MRDKTFHYEFTATGFTRHGDLANAHIHALRQARVDLQAHRRQRLIGHGGAMTAAERTLDDRLLSEATDLEQAIVTAERERDNDPELRGLRGGPSPTVRAARGRRFAEMFPGRALDRGGFASAEEFLGTIHAGLADPRLVHTYDPRLGATMTTQVDSSGGFSVPTQFFQEWLDASLESEIVRSRADVRPMTSSSANAPGWDDGTHTSNLYGGFAGAWANEGADLTLEETKMRMIALRARKLGILTKVSNELIADGLGFEAQLGQAIPKALAWFLDDSFLNGNGADRPLGVINAGCTITVAKETNQAAATINYTNLAKMFARMLPGSHARSVWVCNSTAIPALLQLSVAVGTGGSHVPVLSQAGDSWTMLTRPVIFTEKVPTVGTKGDIGLYDFSQYIVGMRADFSLAKSQHVGFTSDTAHYRGIIRVDGQPKLAAPITPKNGDTLSPFVVLATRA